MKRSGDRLRLVKVIGECCMRVPVDEDLLLMNEYSEDRSCRQYWHCFIYKKEMPVYFHSNHELSSRFESQLGAGEY